MNQDTAVLLLNLGTPEAPNPSAVGRYLTQFLLDPEVITGPWAFRQFLVRGIIVPFRKSKSAALYQKIWTPRGSPLAFHTQDLVSDLQMSFTGLNVFSAFRYGNPSFEETLKEIQSLGFNNLFILPLYPQYATSTQRTSETELRRLRVWERFENVRFIKSYHNQDFYLDSVTKMIREKWHAGSHLVFTFHGIPEAHVTENHPGCDTCVQHDYCQKSGDVMCYKRQCTETAEALAQRLSLSPGDWSLSFQSRLGRARWLLPSTVDKIRELTRQGKKNLTLVAPGFSADCLETMEEMDVELREVFNHEGGQDWCRVMCLNSEPYWVDQLGRYLINQLQEMTNGTTSAQPTL
ncbi:MAG: ferrochelatase [Bdellovibrio sp.]